MKKILLSIMTMALMGLSLPSMAQYESPMSTIEARKVRFGLYVAPTLSWMKPTTDKTDDGEYAPKNDGSKLGFTYGLMGEYYFAENYAFVAGLQVNMGGGKIGSKYVGNKTTGVVQQADFNYKLNYLEVPLALKLRTDLISDFRFFGQIGLNTGINIVKKADYVVAYKDENGIEHKASATNEKVKGTLAIAPVMFSMSIGAGAEYTISNKVAAYMGLFFNNGFAPDATNPNKYDLPYGLPFKDGNTRFNNFALRVGIFF